jgi:hypothetical protein
MDEFYDDLPAGLIDRTSQFFQGKAPAVHSSNELNDKPQAKQPVLTEKVQSNLPNSTLLKTEPVKANKPPVSANKFVPTSLLFKPRQTSVVKTENPKPKDIVSTSKTKFAEETIVISKSVPAERNIQTKKQKIDEEAPVEFNSAASFEVSGDPYDPRRPNDYLQFCQERDEQKRIQFIKEENKRQLEEMERQRLDMERQRKEMVDKQDYQKLYDFTAAEHSSGGIGRGRGRGVVNLPAWMVQQVNTNVLADEESKKQGEGTRAEQFQSEEIASSSSSLPSSSSTMPTKRKISAISKPSTILILKNILTKQELDKDPSIPEDVQSECEKFGKILRCYLHTSNIKTRGENEVYIFLIFERQDSAIRAMR